MRIGWRRGSGFGVNDANANVRRLGARARGEVEGRRERGRARGVEDTHVHGVSAVSLALVLPVLAPELFHLRRLRVGEPARLVPSRGRARGCPLVLIFRRGRLARGAKRGDRLRRRGRGRGNLLHQTHGARARNSAGCDHNGTWCAAVQASTPRAFSKVVVQSARLSVYLHLGHIAERVVDAFPPLDMGEESVAIIEESSPAGDAKRLSLDGWSAQSLDDASGLSRSAAPNEASDSPAARAEALIDDDRLLEAARVCRDAGLSTPLDIPGADFPVERETVRKVNHYLPKAARMNALLDSLKSDPNAPDTEWLVQGEHMGRRDVSIYYRVDPETSSKLTARIESPISRDMLVPLLSVLNESELYKTWVPNWTVPRLRMRRSDKLHQHGRCSQVVLVTMDLPWPFSSREAVLDACGVDDIDAAGDICVLVESLDAPPPPAPPPATDPRILSSREWTRLTPFASISKAGSYSARSRADGARRGARFPRRRNRRRRRGSRAGGANPPSRIRRTTRTRRRRRRRTARRATTSATRRRTWTVTTRTRFSCLCRCTSTRRYPSCRRPSCTS